MAGYKGKSLSASDFRGSDVVCGDWREENKSRPHVTSFKLILFDSHMK